jgi:SAM-dependent methyltransferase
MTTAPAAPPRIFSPQRRAAARRRLLALQQRPDAPRYVMEDMVEDALDRLAFLRHRPQTALVMGDFTGAMAQALTSQGVQVTSADVVAHGNAPALAEESPWPFSGFDLIVSLGTLDTVNDLPGALIHMRQALASGGLALISMMAAGSLPALRQIMLEADGDRPAARMHPAVDVRSGAQLLQRVGLANPVADARGIDVRFRSLDALVNDLRAQGLGSVLADAAPAAGKAALARALSAFVTLGDAQGRVTEHLEVLTLSGWRP